MEPVVADIQYRPDDGGVKQGIGASSMNSDVFERVKEIPIESVLREYFPSLDLKRAGQDVIARCPFHDESTASSASTPKRIPGTVLAVAPTADQPLTFLLMGEIASHR